MMNKKNMKKIAAALLTALTFTAPVSVEAHYLSSRQEKEIGNKAVEDFQKEYATFEAPILTHVQNRIMAFNSDKLWFYGTPGQKRAWSAFFVRAKAKSTPFPTAAGRFLSTTGCSTSFPAASWDRLIPKSARRIPG